MDLDDLELGGADYDEIKNFYSESESESETEYENENMIEHKKTANVSKLKQPDPKIDYVKANICMGCEGSFESNTILKHLNHPKKAQCKAHYDEFTLSYMESQRKKAAVERIQEWRVKNKMNISSNEKYRYKKMDKNVVKKKNAEYWLQKSTKMKESGYHKDYLNDELIKVVKDVQCKNCDKFFRINSILKHLNHHSKKKCKEKYTDEQLICLKQKSLAVTQFKTNELNRDKRLVRQTEYYKQKKTEISKMRADYYMKNKSKVKNKNAENYKKKTAKKEATKSNEIVAENVLKSQKIKDKISKRKAVYYQTKLKPRKEVLKIEKSIENNIDNIKIEKQKFHDMVNGKLKCFKNNCIKIYIKEIETIKAEIGEKPGLQDCLPPLTALEKKIDSFIKKWQNEIDSNFADICKLSDTWQRKYDIKVEEVSTIPCDWTKIELIKQVAEISNQWKETIKDLKYEKLKILGDSMNSVKSEECKEFIKNMDKRLRYVCEKVDIERAWTNTTECHCHPVKDHCKGILSIVLHGCNFTCKKCRKFKVASQYETCHQCRMEVYHMETYGNPFTYDDFLEIKLSDRKNMNYKDYLRSLEKSIESTESEMESNYSFKRSKPKFTMADLDEEMEEDSEYKANVGDCGGKILPKRKCKTVKIA